MRFQISVVTTVSEKRLVSNIKTPFANLATQKNQQKILIPKCMTKSRNQILSTIFLLFFVSFGFAQNLEIRGTVTEDDQSPLQDASIYLLTTGDNEIVKTTITDASGNYLFVNVSSGEYFIKSYSMGYEVQETAPFTVNGKDVKMEGIVLSITSEELEEVALVAKVPIIQQRDGKLILNVEDSSLSAGNTAFDVLQRAPGVSVDKDNNIQLMGQSGAMVTIDGRQTYLSGEQLATLLKTMDGDQIKSIEVSTIRSAKDDAEGTTGTINIVLKKNQLEGMNGTFTASAGYGKHFRGNSSVNLNYKKNNTTLFGTYGYSNNEREFDIDIYRTLPTSDGRRVFDQQGVLGQKAETHNFKIGIEQKTSDRNTMLLQFSNDRNKEKALNHSVTYMGLQNSEIDSLLNTTSHGKTQFVPYTLNFNNEFLLDTIGGKLVLDLDYSAFRTKTDIDYLYENRFPNGDLIYAPELERSRMPVDIDIYVGKLDFTKNIGKGKFESGVKFSHVESDNNLEFEHFVDGSWQDYEGRPNHFLYKEQVGAVYADYGQAFGKTYLKIGLRGEYTVSDGNSITLNSRVKRDYFDLFPSASLGYSFEGGDALSLSYARKIGRPNYRNLNPFEYYIDKYSYQRGNPYLNPQYTDGFVLNYTLKRRYNFTIGTDITHDAMVESLGHDLETGIGWITQDNLGRQWTSYLNVNLPFQVTDFWTMNTNLTGIYLHFKGEIAGSYINDGKAFFQGRTQNNFRISDAVAAEMSANYVSPFLYNVYKIHGRWGMDLGFTYNFKDERSSLKLAATDIFKTQKNNVSTDFGEFDAAFNQYYDQQSVRLTFTYKFGNLKQQIRRKSADSDEKSRATSSGQGKF